MWKESLQTNIYKKGNTGELSNYRPINMSCVLYKVFMTVLTNRLNSVVEKAGILSDMQSGFRNHRSTHQWLLTLISRLDDAKRNNKKIFVGYLDIWCAYDSVEHWALKQVLERYGFDKNFVELIHNVLSGSFTRVTTPYGKTEKVFFNVGVKQGCLMSPLLFLLFLNPLLEYINKNIRGYSIDNTLSRDPCGAFADDMVLITEDFQQIKKAFQIVENFCTDTNLELNLGKDIKDKSKTAWTTNDTACKNCNIEIKNLQGVSIVYLV